MEILSVQDISKSFGSTKALDNVSFDVDQGEIAVLLGPSGCGKSTLLTVIAGLEPADQGEVRWNGISLAHTPPHLREFGLMFQDFALFPHMNVYANVAFGLKMAHMHPESIDQRVHEMLGVVGLPDFSTRDVNTLSGGEQQRIALARALAPHPRLLMLDEPLGSLDRNLRERLVVDLQTILHQMNQTAIYVTHDQEEAFTVADRIILMNSGWIEQMGTPQEIYNNPASSFVAKFLEMTNIVPAFIQYQDGKRLAITDLGDFSVDSQLDGKVNLLIRPDMARLDDKGPLIIRGLFTGTSFRGSSQRITMVVNHIALSFELSTLVALPGVGTQLTLSMDSKSAIQIFPKE
jgi:ABC-type Fe3+/spermidine/putrescine transport system ATPase subunit